jgi:rubrerythrin
LKTDENLQKNFSVEAMASVRYSCYAEIAEKDGYHQIAKLFRTMSKAEKVHATNTMKIIGGIDNTSENLTSAVDNKTYEFTQWYPTLVEQADLDANPIASTTFRGAADTAKTHVALLNEALENIGRNKETDYWVCNACGYIYSGDIPVSCKICGASREKFNQSG